jgi:pseudouridine kinase
LAEVVVIGGANVDIKGRAQSLVLPGTSNPGQVTISPGGVGRNVAENLARLDVDVALVSMVGDDANGQLVRAATAKCGVDVSMIGTGSAPTGTYLAVLDGSGEMVTAVNDMRVIDDLSPGFLAQYEGKLAAADLLVADCNLPVSSLAWLASLSARAGRRLLIDPISIPKSRKLLALRVEAPLFALMANRLQIESLTGQSELEAAAKQLHRMGFENVVIHLGREGVMVSEGSGPTAKLPALPVEGIADVTGAGDAAVAGLTLGLLMGLTLLDAARLGQAAAALNLQSLNSVAEDVSRDRLFSLAALAQDHK